MNSKHIFFGLCVFMMIGSEIFTMQLVRKRTPRSMCRVNNVSSMVQKRNGMFTEAIGMALGLAPVACMLIGMGGLLDSLGSCTSRENTPNEKAFTVSKELPNFELKIPNVKLLTGGSQQLYIKAQDNREFLDKIKTITVMGTKTWQSDNQQQCNQQRYAPKQQYIPQQYGKVDDSRRSDDASRDLTKFMMNAYVATQICGNLIAHSDSSSSSSHGSYTESYSSQSYSDSSSSLDSSAGGYSNNE